MSPRSSQRVDRRRRVLNDESRNEAAPTRPRIFRGDDEGPLCRYNAAALTALNAPIAKYIPLRPYSLVIWFLTGLIPIIGLMLLHQRRFEISQFVGSDAFRLFDIDSPGNLVGWCASITFAVAVPLILGIYSVRRHRRDDYRGRFAVWQWVITIALLASIDAATGLHRIVQGACTHFLGELAWGNGAAWWIGVWSVLFGVTIVRLLFEMASSTKSVGWLVAAAACYLVCAMIELNVGQVGNSNIAQSMQIPVLLLGHHFALFSLVNYARDVVREAMGMVKAPAQRKAKPTKTKETAKAKRKKNAPEPKAEPSKQSDKTSVKQPAKDAPQLRAVSVAAGDEELKDAAPKSKKKSSPLASKMKVVHDAEADEEEIDMSKLSKSERRRLRKEQKRRRAA